MELQAALDSLKHGIEPDEEILREIRKQVNHAPWLKCKRAQRVQDLLRHSERRVARSAESRKLRLARIVLEVGVLSLLLANAMLLVLNLPHETTDGIALARRHAVSEPPGKLFVRRLPVLLAISALGGDIPEAASQARRPRETLP